MTEAGSLFQYFTTLVEKVEPTGKKTKIIAACWAFHTRDEMGPPDTWSLRKRIIANMGMPTEQYQEYWKWRFRWEKKVLIFRNFCSGTPALR